MLLALWLGGDGQCFVAPRADFPAQKTKLGHYPFVRTLAGLDGFQVFDQVVLLPLGQAQFEDTIVMVDDVRQGRLHARLLPH